MTCTPQALVLAAICFTKFHKHDLDAMAIYLLCQWEAHKETVSWTPASYVARWDEGSGFQFGDLATFLATANFNAVTKLRITDASITDIHGLSALPNLQELTITDSQMTGIDLSGNPDLTDVIANGTGLLSLDLSGHAALINLVCDNSRLLNLDCHDCTSLVSLHCQQSELGTVNIHNCGLLTLDNFWVYDNPQTLSNPPLNVIP